jgi:hypothetical protein
VTKTWRIYTARGAIVIVIHTLSMVYNFFEQTHKMKIQIDIASLWRRHALFDASSTQNRAIWVLASQA